MGFSQNLDWEMGIRPPPPPFRTLYIYTTSGSRSRVIHKEKRRVFFIYTLVLCQYYSNVIQNIVNLTKSEKATNQPPSHGSRRKMRIN